MIATYHGETRRWNFEHYVKLQVDQHHILDGLKEHGYSGIDTQSKVQYLLDGIKTNAFEAVKAQILSNPALWSDFDACVNLYKDFIKQKDASSNVSNRKSTVAAFKTNQDSRSDDGNADMTVDDHYYTNKEYATLFAAKKAGLQLK